MAQYNNQLEPVCSVAHVGINIINVSLVREIKAPNDTKQYKPEYFFFVSCAKGNGSPQQRTYDFQNQFSAKYSIDEVISLSFIMKQFAVGNPFSLKGGYAKFCANGKSVSGQVGEYKGKTVLSLYFNDSNNKIAESLAPEVAFSFGTRLEKLYNLAIDRETQRVLDNPNINQNTRKQQMEQAPQANPYPDNNPYGTVQNFQQPQQNFQQPTQAPQQMPFGMSNQQPQPQSNNPFDNLNSDFNNMMNNFS